MGGRRGQGHEEGGWVLCQRGQTARRAGGTYRADREADSEADRQAGGRADGEGGDEEWRVEGRRRAARRGRVAGQRGWEGRGGPAAHTMSVGAGTRG